MNNLIINGIDHSKFDIPLAKRGGVVMLKKHLSKVTYVCNISGTLHVAQTLGQKVFNGESFANVSPRLLRMATPDECSDAGIEYIEPLYAELEELRKDRDLLQFCLDNDTFPVKDQNGAYIMSKQNELFALSTSARHSIEFAMDYEKFKADNAMRGEK